MYRYTSMYSIVKRIYNYCVDVLVYTYVKYRIVPRMCLYGARTGLFEVLLDKGLYQLPYGHIFVYRGVLEALMQVFTDIGC